MNSKKRLSIKLLIIGIIIGSFASNTMNVSAEEVLSRGVNTGVPGIGGITNSADDDTDWGTEIILGTWGTSEWTYDPVEKILTIGEGEFAPSTSENRPPWHDFKDHIVKVVITGNIKANESSGFLFTALSKVKTIENLNKINTSDVTDMSGMFYGCLALEEIDLSNFNTSKVTTMEAMFNNCRTVSSLDFSAFDTSSVTNMSRMFHSCYALTTIDFSNFITTNVTDMSSMFQGCTGLKTLDISAFNTSKVTTMKSMFYGNTGLTHLNTGALDASNVTDMSSMFYNCSNLQSLDMSGWKTENLKTMKSMFYGNGSLEELNVSGLNTSSVEEMGTLFYNCINLKSLDLSTWDTSSVTSMSSVFYKCSELESITLGEKSLFTANVPAVTTTDTSYTGKWIGLTTGTTYAKSSSFLSVYDGTTPDTYVKERNLTATFDTNGGTEIAVQALKTTGKVTQPSEPEKAGYIFSGWFADSEYVNGWDFNTGLVDDVTIYAEFTPIVYDLTFKDGDASFTNWSQGYSVPATYTADDYVLLPTPENLSEKAGYVFAGWYESDDFSGESVTMIAKGSLESRTYYAKYVTEGYNILYKDGENDFSNWADDYVSPIIYTTEETVTLPISNDLREKAGYIFVGWYESSDFSGEAVTEISLGSTGLKTLYAKYEAVDYAIQYHDGEEAFSNWKDGYSAPTGYTVTGETTLPTSANIIKPGYAFVGWYEKADLSGEPVTVIQAGTMGEKNYYAKYIEVDIQIVDNYNDNDGIIVAKGTYNIELTLNGVAMDDHEIAQITWSVENVAGFASNLEIITTTDGSNVIQASKSGVVKLTAIYNGNEASIVIVKAGDIDKSGTIDYDDLANLVDYIKSDNLEDLASNTEYVKYLADFNGDGFIDYDDVADLIDVIKGVN